MENKRDYVSQCTPHTVATFQAFADAVIPRTPKLAKTLGPEFVSGALDLQVDQYLIWELDHSITIQGYFIPKRIVLSEPTAYLLDAAATHLIATGRAKYPHHELKFPGGGIFAALARSDRFRAITLLELLDIDLGCLPQPFQNNAGLVLNITNAINRLVMFGYYSEWSGYGTTRLAPPTRRRLEEFPVGWTQSAYPGPSYGYRELRGFLLTIPREKGEFDET